MDVVRWAEATKQRDQPDGGRRSCFVVAGCSGWWFPALVGVARAVLGGVGEWERGEGKALGGGEKSFGQSVGAGPSFGERERQRAGRG